MARALRIEFSGALYHITSRGDRREDIYEDDDDRQAFLSLLGDVCRTYNWDCHGYCLMSNHYHLLIETADGNLSKGMRQLNGVYSQKYNRRHCKVGHVFQGRYTSILIEKESYLLELTRYIVLNPVRACMVEQPGDWKWSSYLFVIGIEKAPDWLNTEWILACFSKNPCVAVKFYIAFVADGMKKKSPLHDVKNQVFLGSDSFVEMGLQMVGESKELSEIPRLQKRALKRPLEYYQKQFNNRNHAIVNAYQSGSYTMKEIGDFFNLSYSMVSRIIKDLKFKM